MLDLNDREWKRFCIGEVFNISNGKRLESFNMEKGSRPFVGASDSNNGITGFVKNENSSLDHNVLGINYNGSVCEAFYHPYECLFSDDVKRLHLQNYEDNEEILLFFAGTIVQQKVKYIYSYKFNSHRMNRQTILLPVTSTGEPDYAFMEQYVKKRQNIMLEEYRKYAEKQLDEIEYKPIKKLEECEWGEFKIDKLFRQERGKEKAPNQNPNGNIPLINETTNNNGFTREVIPTKVFKGNSLTVSINFARNVFYQPFDYCASVNIVPLQSKYINQYSGLFISSELSRQNKYKYNYSYKQSKERLDKQIIRLPVTSTGEPDYEYMEQYSKNIVKIKLTDFLKFINEHYNDAGELD